MLTDGCIQTLADLPRIQGKLYGDKVALVCGGEITYAEFDARTNKVANALIDNGLDPHARVAWVNKDSASCLEVIFGGAKANAVTLGVNWRLSPSEMSYIINDARAEILFVGEEFFPKIEMIEDGLTSVRKIVALSGSRPRWEPYARWMGEQSDVDPQLPVRPDHVAVQMYTSGTTGYPKGVMLANYSFFAVIDEMLSRGINWFDWCAEDVSLLNIPLFHIGGLWWAIRGLASGAKNILMDTFVAWKALDFFQRFRVTKVCLVPAMIQLILAEQNCGKTDFSSLKHVAYGGSPISLSSLRQAMATFKCSFTQLYGMTETGNMAVNLPGHDHDPDESRLMRAAGKALPGVALRVIDGGGNSLPPLGVGEICIKSPANMLGYWNLPEETSKVLVDGWVHTGDAGYLDEDGYLFICDRIKDMIIYAGENIYPAEIEGVINSHEAVAEVAVIGVPDRRWGESIKALVVLNAGAKATAADIIGYTRRHIADFKVPKSVEFVDCLPRTPSGKLRKAEIRSPYWEGYERKIN